MLTVNEIYDLVGELNSELVDESGGEHTEIIVDAYVCAIVSVLRGASGNDADTLRINGDFLVEQLKLKLDSQIGEALTDAVGITKH